MGISTNQSLFAAYLALSLIVPTIALGEEVGTSCADCPSYTAAFSIENTTGVAISYNYRWGNKHPWKTMRLESGHIETHTYPLGENRNGRAPIPYVRFDRVGGDSNFTGQEYRMEFFATGYAGYGPSQNKTEPKRYVFRYASDGKNLDLKAK